VILVAVLPGCGLALVLLAFAAAIAVMREPAQLVHDSQVSEVLPSSLLPQPIPVQPVQAQGPGIAAMPPAAADTPQQRQPPAKRQDPDGKKELSRLEGEQAKHVEPKAEKLNAGVKTVFKRRQQQTEGQLLEMLARVPAVALDRTVARRESNALLKVALLAQQSGHPHQDLTLRVLEQRPDLAGLPLRRGRACCLSKAVATQFDTCAPELRVADREPGMLRTRLETLYTEETWRKEETVPVLMQMLMADASEVREVLVDRLARMKGERATSALAQIALFDLHPGVREAAIRELASRPAKDSCHVLLKGFEHPWPVIAEHAAEAIVALHMHDLVPSLVKLLDRRDPRMPYRKDSTERYYVKNLVRVNHLRNCLLCHPPSLNGEGKVRGLVPSTNKALDSGSGGYFGSATGIFVRADITYLKQDFSAMLPVAKPRHWPARQRFDFFVRERLATPIDIQAALRRKKASPSDHQQSILFALRELTNRDLGAKVADWKAFARGKG
jgi:hypothetical protein